VKNTSDGGMRFVLGIHLSKLLYNTLFCSMASGPCTILTGKRCELADLSGTLIQSTGKPTDDLSRCRASRIKIFSRCQCGKELSRSSGEVDPSRNTPARSGTTRDRARVREEIEPRTHQTGPVDLHEARNRGRDSSTDRLDLSQLTKALRLCP
jgi:hypothetical protein